MLTWPRRSRVCEGISAALIATIAISGCTPTASSGPDGGSVGDINSPRGQLPDAAPGRGATESTAIASGLKPASLQTRTLCADICDRSRTLKCKHADECLSNCVAMATATPCSEQVIALYKCLVRYPVARWECDEDGVAAIRDGLCDQEQGKVVSCMESHMQP